MFKPDGWGWRARIGVLTTHIDLNTESELNSMAPEGVSIHATRVPLQVPSSNGVVQGTLALDKVRALVEPPNVDNAVELLSAAPLHAIGVTFTSSSYALGPQGDEALRIRLEQRTRGIPVVVTCASATIALRALGVRRLAVLSPPWFSEQLVALGAEYFRAAGVEVVYSAPIESVINENLVQPGLVYEWVRAHVPAQAEGLFIGGNGFRVIGAIDALEEDLRRPVLTANQVLFWRALQLTGTRAPVTGYGRIFEMEPPVLVVT